MKFNIFDNFFDPIFVIDEEQNIVYGNESAANMCDISAKRISNNKKIYDLISFSDPNLFSMPGGKKEDIVEGHFVELESTVSKGSVHGKYQVAFLKTDEKKDSYWLMVMRDVALEQTLQYKYKDQVGEKQKIINELVKAQLELKGYSKNLEKRVEERTAEVKRANNMLNAIMNSLGQGFLVFDKDGICGDIYTKACKHILESSPSGKTITNVLKLNNKKKSEFESWIKAAFEELLPFESLIELGLKTYKHSEGMHISLEYFPIRNEDNVIDHMVLVATDSTSEYLANVALDKEKQYTQLILRIVKNKSQFLNFLTSTQSKIDTLKQDSPDIETHNKKAFRMLHTIEGEAGLFGAMSISKISRKAQEVIEPIKTSNRAESIEEITRNYIFEIDDLTSQFLDFNKSNQDLFKRLGLYGDKRIEIEESEVKGFMDLIKETGNDNLLKEFQARFLKKSIKDMLYHYNELMFDMCKDLGKEINPVAFNGAEIMLLEDEYKDLFETFVHIFRNTMDHGMLTPDAREALGKDRQGLVSIECEKQIENKTEYLFMKVIDDGEGIDPERIKSKLKVSFPDMEIDSMTNEEIIQQVFLPGFSSRDEVSKFSGRGVGLDAVKTEVVALGGTIIVDSIMGLGTTFEIKIPLDKSIANKLAA